MIPASEPQPRLDSLGQPLLQDLGDVDWFALHQCQDLTPEERLIQMEACIEFALEMYAAGEAYRAGQRKTIGSTLATATARP